MSRSLVARLIIPTVVIAIGAALMTDRGYDPFGHITILAGVMLGILVLLEESKKTR